MQYVAAYVLLSLEIVDDDGAIANHTTMGTAWCQRGYAECAQLSTIQKHPKRIGRYKNVA